MPNDACVYDKLTAILNGIDDSGKVVFSKDVFSQCKKDLDNCILDILKPGVPIWENDSNKTKCEDYLVILKRFNSFTPVLSSQIKYCSHKNEKEMP